MVMKKIYRKPSAVCELFNVSEFIAGNCEHDVGFGDTGASKLCSIEDPDYPGLEKPTLFNDKHVCEILWDDGYDTGCYHIPTEGHGYFGS